MLSQTLTKVDWCGKEEQQHVLRSQRIRFGQPMRCGFVLVLAKTFWKKKQTVNAKLVL